MDTNFWEEHKPIFLKTGRVKDNTYRRGKRHR